MTTREFRHAEPNNRSDDPRITDAVVQAAVAAGLKAPPRIEDFCRAVLGAALPLIELAPAVTLPASPARRRELLHKSRDFARVVVSETTIREQQDMIAAQVYDLLEGVLNPERTPAISATAETPDERPADPGDDHGLYFSDDEGSGA